SCSLISFVEMPATVARAERSWSPFSVGRTVAGGDAATDGDADAVALGVAVAAGVGLVAARADGLGEGVGGGDGLGDGEGDGAAAIVPNPSCVRLRVRICTVFAPTIVTCASAIPKRTITV